MRVFEVAGVIGAGLMALVLVIGLGIGLFLVGQQVRRWVAPIEGETGVVEFRESAANRIVRYEHFFDLCASVQTFEERIDRFDAAIAETEPNTRDREIALANLNSSRIGRADAVNQYNQDALKDYTGAEFRDSDLPYQLPRDYSAGGVRTECAFQ